MKRFDVKTVVLGCMNFTLGLSYCIAQSQEGVPKTQDLFEALEKYESSFYGLSFEPGVDVVGRPARGIQLIEYVSRDGRIRCWEGKLLAPNSSAGRKFTGQEFAGKAVASKGWVFQVSRAIVSGAKRDEAGMTVTFHPPNSTSALARDVPNGYMENRTFAEYAQDSISTVSSETVFGIPVWTLSCDHPVGASVQFFFQRDPLRLVGITWKRVAGDQFRLGPIFVEPRVLRSGQWVTSTLGPIEYGEFFERELPISIPFTGDSSEPSSQITGVNRFSNYSLLESDLSSKIEFPTFELPDEGERVTSQGEEAIRYEVRNGELVKIVDSEAITAAKRSRFFSSAVGSKWWYLSGAILFVIILFFLIKRRSV